MFPACTACHVHLSAPSLTVAPPSPLTRPPPPLARPPLRTICHYAIRPGFGPLAALAVCLPVMFVGQKPSHGHGKAGGIGSGERARDVEGKSKGGEVKVNRKGSVGGGRSLREGRSLRRRNEKSLRRREEKGINEKRREKKEKKRRSLREGRSLRREGREEWESELGREGWEEF